ncbi:MAG: response regulator [Myxococcales bacterium]|nr:response regulator [Myxococcales bacterium]
MPKTLSLLIVDDNPGDREIYTCFLQKDTERTYQIHEAATLEEARQCIAKTNFDVVFLDYGLPDGPGLKLIECLEENSDETPAATVIMLTGQGGEEIAAEALRAGISDYIIKDSFNAQVLIHAVEAALSRARLRRKLKHRNDELRALASTMAHDLRTPLATTQKSAAILKRSAADKLNDKERRILDRIIASHQRMDRLMVDMIKYSRVDASKEPTHPISLPEVLHEVLLDLEGQIDESGALISIGSLPIVVGEHHHFRSLFMNLIGNAIKFSADAPPEIRIFTEKFDDESAVCVEDQGIGLDCRHASRIFEIFQRLHTEDEYSGTGLGLAICKKIVGNWGGRIWVDSVPGNGCRFYFTVETAKKYASLPAPRVRPKRRRPVWVAIGHESGNNQQARNISSTGIGIYCDPSSNALTVGQEIDLKLELPSLLPFALNGIVRHVTQQSSVSSHVGVEFFGLETDQRAHICHYIDHRE